MDWDDLDDLAKSLRKAETEARFRALEREAELEQLRREVDGLSPGESKKPRDKKTPTREAEPDREEDDLDAMKAALDSDAPLPRYLLLLCPHCGAKNRTDLGRLRTRLPLCGACKKGLSFTRLPPET